MSKLRTDWRLVVIVLSPALGIPALLRLRLAHVHRGLMFASAVCHLIASAVEASSNPSCLIGIAVRRGSAFAGSGRTHRALPMGRHRPVSTGLGQPPSGGHD